MLQSPGSLGAIEEEEGLRAVLTADFGSFREDPLVPAKMRAARCSFAAHVVTSAGYRTASVRIEQESNISSMPPASRRRTNRLAPFVRALPRDKQEYTACRRLPTRARDFDLKEWNDRGSTGWHGAVLIC